MQQYIIDHIIRVYYIKLAALAAQLRNGYAKKLTHHFRTDMKKLRAFYRLMSLEAGKELQLPRGLKKLYRNAGNIRDLQLQLKNAEEYAQKAGVDLDQLQTILKRKLKPLLKNDKAIPSSRYFVTQRKKAERLSPPQLRAETLQLFFWQKKEAIGLIVVKARFSSTELHCIRKNIKDILYVTSIYMEDIGSSLPLLFHKNGMKELDELADELGQYNDTISALSFLKSVSAAFGGKDRQNALSYYNNLVREKKDRRDKLLARLGAMPLLASTASYQLQSPVSGL